MSCAHVKGALAGGIVLFWEMMIGMNGKRYQS